MASKKQLQSAVDAINLTFWIAGVVALFLAAIYTIFYEETSILPRSVALLAAIAFPAGLLFFQNATLWQAIWQQMPDPILLVLSGVAGLTIWPIAWWVMSVADTYIFSDLFGPLEPPALYLAINLDQNWVLLVLTDVVLVPLALMVLLWGVLRFQLAALPLWQSVLLLGGIFGVYGTLLYGQGLVGFLGYGLCGGIAAFVSLKAKTGWAGLATHGVFMYANLNFLDDLLREMTQTLEGGGRASEPYVGTKWLSLVLLSGLVTLATLQIMRFLSESVEAQPTTRPKIQVHVFLVGFILLLVLLFVFLNEINQRSTISL